VDEVEAPDEVATLPSVARVLASINAPAEEGEEEDEVRVSGSRKYTRVMSSGLW
jgi:hypothetical protein